MDVLQANVAWILGWASAAMGGPAAAAAFVLANRNVWLVRSLCAMVSALALPYVALVVVLWAAFCGRS